MGRGPEEGSAREGPGAGEAQQGHAAGLYASATLFLSPSPSLLYPLSLCPSLSLFPFVCLSFSFSVPLNILPLYLPLFLLLFPSVQASAAAGSQPPQWPGASAPQPAYWNPWLVEKDTAPASFMLCAAPWCHCRPFPLIILFSRPQISLLIQCDG